jgi:hypothetical protein
MPQDRSRRAAMESLMSLRSQVIVDADDPVVANLLSEALVTEIFEEAWNSQFDAENSEFQQRVREIVTLAIDEAQAQGPAS